MAKKSKQLSNTFSTGGGGSHFEAHVHASFVALMLAGGFAPCMPSWPISELKLQAKSDGYDIDDLIIFVEKPGSDQKRKILCQIKHSINITENDETFCEVIQAAWNDFNNKKLFSKGKDVIALITGPLSATDINDVRPILEWARHLKNADEFIEKVEKTRVSSQKKQNKLKAFKTNLRKANGDIPISNKELFEFLKHFHLLGYDLDIKSGVTLSLLHSLIGQYSQENAYSIWTQIVEDVQSFNKNGGNITLQSISEDIREAFKQKTYVEFPKELSTILNPLEQPDWNQLPYASDLAFTNLLGSWDEKNKADLDIIQQLTRKDAGSWLSSIREILQQPASPLMLKNGKWDVTAREDLWKILGVRLFDETLDIFKQCAVNVLTERDPQFDLHEKERFTAQLHGKIFTYSSELRKGIAESLAILGNKFNFLSNSSQSKGEVIAVTTIREVFKNADWILWGSLNDLLPMFAEAAPNEFLNSVENALQESPCPFDKLFSQEGQGFAGRNYLTGLLWALETLAWDQEFLIRTSIILAELATHDPGGNWANRPFNSLQTIFLPWYSQTTAPINKRKVAMQTLQREIPEIAWKLALKLLPNQHQVSSGSRKPSWRNPIPDDWGKNISKQEYWEQVLFYAESAVSMASNNMDRLNEIVAQLDNLPKPSLDKVLQLLSSEDILNKSEEERLTIWNSLIEFTSKHKRFHDAKWALPSEIINEIERISLNLSPTNPTNLYRRLFNNQDFDLYEENDNWEEQRKKLEQKRSKALNVILEQGGLNSVLQFAEAVESPSRVGYSLGLNTMLEGDSNLLPTLLEIDNKKLTEFICGYIWTRQLSGGLTWVDGLNKSGWSRTQISQFLRCLPFTNETWHRVNTWLGNSQDEYWAKVNANPYDSHGDLKTAIEKLIDYGRPNAAINCLSKMQYDKQFLDKSLAVRALLAAVASKEPKYAMDIHNITEIIKSLQNDPTTNPDDLFQVEWAYLPLLDHYRGASPKLLENRLASDSMFFCELIRLVYRSKKEVDSKQEPTESEKAIATNAWELLHKWKIPPGTQHEGIFSEEKFKEWLENVKKSSEESGHLEVAYTHIGHVLIYCPSDPEGLWINRTVAAALNAKDAEDMRNGFHTELFNSRGVHSIDPTGKEDRELANQYRQKAEAVENAGYQRLAVTLRHLADEYDHDADRYN